MDCLEIEDAYHGPQVLEDKWGHNNTYYAVEKMIQQGKGWKELIYTVKSDVWLRDLVINYSDDRGDEVHKRKSQPETWDMIIKERDGWDSGAKVELWYKENEDDGNWKMVKSPYEVTGVEDSEEEEEDGDGDEKDGEVVVEMVETGSQSFGQSEDQRSSANQAKYRVQSIDAIEGENGDDQTEPMEIIGHKFRRVLSGHTCGLESREVRV